MEGNIMYVSKNDYNRIIANYERALQKNEDSLNLRKNKIYSTNSRFSEIDEKINALQISKIKESLNGNTNISIIDKKISSLKEEKENLLKTLGYSIADVQKKYSCPICKDTGYVNTEICICLKKFFVDFIYENSHLKEKFEHENFSTFDLNYYSTAKLKDEKFSPKDNIKVILDIAHSFCNNFNGEENLFFFGQAGLGKTFMCNAIAKELLDKSFSVVYYSACDLFKIVSDDTFNKDYCAGNHIIDNIYNAELLIIDDLGTEFKTSLSTSEFFRILNSRIDCHKSTIISSNLNLNDIRDNYSERISSRLIQNFKILKFLGDDIRIKSKINQTK